MNRTNHLSADQKTALGRALYDALKLDICGAQGLKCRLSKRDACRLHVLLTNHNMALDILEASVQNFPTMGARLIPKMRKAAAELRGVQQELQQL
jgi:hypothetical protein